MSKIVFQNVTQLPKSLYRFYLDYGVKNYRIKAFCWMIAVLVMFSGGVIWPNFQRWVVALFERPVPMGETFVEYAVPTILLITFLNMFMTVSELVRDTISSHMWPGVMNQISEVLTTYTHRQSMSFWSGKMSGSINTQINYIVDGLTGGISELWYCVGRLMIILINGILLLSINKYVAYLFVFSLVFRIIYAWKMRTRVKKASEDASGATSALNGKLVDSFSNYSIVKLFAGAEKERKILDEPRQKRIKAFMYSRYTMRLFWAVPGLLWDLLFGTTILLCCMLYQKGLINVSEIVFTISVYIEVMGAVSNLINRFPDIIDKMAAAKKAYRELVVPLDIIDKENAKKLKINHGRIEFKNIYFKYRNRYVLKDLSLNINPGERVGIVGVSGSGKTTLVNLLMRFYEPQKGEIFIDGQNVSDVTQNSLRENIAFIPQDPTMFNRTIGENIGYGKFNASIKEIRSASKKASADKFIMDTEKGYDSLVGDRGIKLSGGQRQRIAIARAFLKNAPILVLDEATSALDSETEIAIQKSFDKLSEGRTTIAIAHRLSTLRNMDRIVVLDKGVIVEQGTHNQLLRKKGEYYRLWQMQSGGFLQEK
ncbi:MAG: ABC transporter ATP-binding protein [Alphaproteobacteria bacterium]|nr:ABC transporter ATP-binding protein [Alphaproteobacteria bacterium]